MPKFGLFINSHTAKMLMNATEIVILDNLDSLA